jgi:hypothetical protein
VSAVRGDFDRDGGDDAVVSCAEPRLVLLRGGQGAGRAPAMELVQGPLDNAFLSAGDVTGDGALDLLAMRPQRLALVAGDGPALQNLLVVRSGRDCGQSAGPLR